MELEVWSTRPFNNVKEAFPPPQWCQHGDTRVDGSGKLALRCAELLANITALSNPTYPDVRILRGYRATKTSVVGGEGEPPDSVFQPGEQT